VAVDVKIEFHGGEKLELCLGEYSRGYPNGSARPKKS